MPILNPSLQLSLVENYAEKNMDTDGAQFFKKYLLLASKYSNRNESTIETSILFKNDLKKSIKFINDEFQSSFTIEKDFNNPIISNYYKYLYKRSLLCLDEQNKMAKIILKGKYLICNDKFSSKFFQPEVFYPKLHSWFLSDTPIAILCINTDKFEDDIELIKIFRIIKLEVDLMAASGLTLVLCVNGSEKTMPFIIDMILDNQFSEIHFNIFHLQDFNEFSTQIDSRKIQFETLSSYLYIYSQYLIDKSENSMNDNPRSKIFFFAKPPQESLIKISITKTNPFPYCVTGFRHKYLRINVQTVPIYDTADCSTSPAPFKITDDNIGYISPSDFLIWKQDRIKIIYDNETENHEHVEKYIDFNNVHKINQSLFVKDTFLLANINKKDIKIVDKIQKNIFQKLNKNDLSTFKKMHNFSFTDKQKIKTNLEYVGYAYSCFIKNKVDDFSIHKSQIYSAYQACINFISGQKSTEKYRKLEKKQEKIEDKELMKEKKIEQEELEKKQEKTDNYNERQMLEKNISNELIQRFNIIKNEEPKEEVIKPKIEEKPKEVEDLKKEEKSSKSIEPNKVNNENDLDKHKKSKNKTNDDYKGVIYQVETGEGKSCIICLIAAVLALMKKTVHIASSNIKLANRDYSNSFDFFKKLGLKSAILLHQNELPFNSNSLKPTKKKNANTDSDSDDDEKDDLLNGENIIKNNDDDLYKGKTDEYIENNVQDENSSYNKEKYPDEFYNDELFKNSSKMNFSVCGVSNNNKITKGKANIIFSTFVNFECFYLRMMEMCPGYVNEYFSNCGLLIDEADSILIDEIANGTIVSRDVKSNINEVLKFVYDQKKSNFNAEQTIKHIKEKWPKCCDITEEHVKRMYNDIEIVETDEFSDGKKYSIEPIQTNNKSKIKRLMNRLIDKISKLKKKLKAEEEEEEEEEDINEVAEGIEDEKDDDGPKKLFHHIVPFDYDHKGILEPNKEFNGFIQQFIAIKENKTNKEKKNIIIKDMSMSYLYVSHPIFVNLYSNVCGFTGTIGDDDDKKIYKEDYNLTTKEVPRYKPNLKVELPMILCKDKKERNEIIVSEILSFHQKRNPVLVIFQDLKEINEIEYILNLHGIDRVNKFDGKDELISPDNIAGLIDSISLGTNVCGRGTNIIQRSSKPLHVIVSYYSAKSRIMIQAFGRTARQGRKGSYRVICIASQFYSKGNNYDNEITKAVISDFQIKNDAQKQFIKNFKLYRPWIFSGKIKKQKLSNDDIAILRKSQINVNRIVAYNFEFPVCMNVDTFLQIQEQKIFSIFNCPNCKYTWILFQRYVREMILESWSLMISEFDYCNIEKGTKEYEMNLQKEIKDLFSKLEKYFPASRDEKVSGIIPTFMNIFNIVNKKYEDMIMNSFKKGSSLKLPMPYLTFGALSLGFKPYSLFSKSSARINSFNTKINYIIDPELKYIQKKPDNLFDILSITERVDEFFNKICQKINECLGEYSGLKFFLRRTLAGCEFGICLDIKIKKKSDQDKENILIDDEPLLVFTISVRSLFPILAGILLMLLTYIAIMSVKITGFISAFPMELPEYVVRKGIIKIVQIVAPKALEKLLYKIINFIKKEIDKNIEKLKEYQSNVAEILKLALSIFVTKNQNINDAFKSALGKFADIKFNIGSISNIAINTTLFIKIGVLLLFCLGIFIVNFFIHKKAIKSAKKDSKKYDNNYKRSNVDELSDMKKDKIDLDDEENMNNDIFNYNVCNTYLYKMQSCDLSKLKASYIDFEKDKEFNIIRNDNDNLTITCKIKKSTRMKCYQLKFYRYKKRFNKNVIFHATNNHPAISNFIGFYTGRNSFNIYIERKGIHFLDEKIHDKSLDIKSKVIISYGIAHAMNYLHGNNIILLSLKPSNIMLDENNHPYIVDFSYAKQIELKSSPLNLNKEKEIQYYPPEYFINPKSCRTSLKFDVFSFGILLFNLFYEKEINEFGLSDEYPKLDNSVNEKWNILIDKCWRKMPEERITFDEICSELESIKVDLNYQFLEKYKNSLCSSQKE